MSDYYTVDNCCIVYFDIETTEEVKNDHLIQISAVIGKHSFNQYVHPKQAIPDDLADATGNNKFYNVFY